MQIKFDRTLKGIRNCNIHIWFDSWLCVAVSECACNSCNGSMSTYPMVCSSTCKRRWQCITTCTPGGGISIMCLHAGLRNLWYLHWDIGSRGDRADIIITRWGQSACDCTYPCSRSGLQEGLLLIGHHGIPFRWWYISIITTCIGRGVIIPMTLSTTGPAATALASMICVSASIYEASRASTSASSGYKLGPLDPLRGLKS
jgi:hypothetical protein